MFKSRVQLLMKLTPAGGGGKRQDKDHEKTQILKKKNLCTEVQQLFGPCKTHTDRITEI